MKKGRKVCHLLDRRETIQVGQQSKMSRRPEEATARRRQGSRRVGQVKGHAPWERVQPGAARRIC